MAYPLVINTFPFIWRYGIEECLDRLATQGHRRTEIILTEPHCWPLTLPGEVRRRVAERIRSGAAEIVSLNLGGFDNNLASPADEVRGLTLKSLSAAIDLAAEWCVKGIVISPGAGRPLLPPPSEKLHGWSRASLEALLPRAESAGVDLLLENIPYSFLPTADGLAGMVEAIDHPNLGVIYDVPNAVFAREVPEEGFSRLKEHIRLVHFSDTVLDTWRHDRLGAGIVKFDEALACMRSIGYEGDLVLEIIDPDGDEAIAASVASLRQLDPAAPS